MGFLPPPHTVAWLRPLALGLSSVWHLVGVGPRSSSVQGSKEQHTGRDRGQGPVGAHFPPLRADVAQGPQPSPRHACQSPAWLLCYVCRTGSGHTQTLPACGPRRLPAELWGDWLSKGMSSGEVIPVPRMQALSSPASIVCSL